MVRVSILLTVALMAIIAGTLPRAATSRQGSVHPVPDSADRAALSSMRTIAVTDAGGPTPGSGVDTAPDHAAFARPFARSLPPSLSAIPIRAAPARLLLQIPPPPLPLPDLPNPFGGLDALDPRAWATDLVDALLTSIGEALIGAMRGFTDWALGLEGGSLNFVTQTPPEGSYASPTVRSLWDYSRAIVNAAFAVIVLWGGLNVMVKEHTRSPYHAAMELLPRLLIGALAANLSLSFARFFIDLNNAVAGGLGEVALPGYDQATPAQEGIAVIVTALAYAVVTLLLVLQMLMRLALVDLLIIPPPSPCSSGSCPRPRAGFAGGRTSSPSPSSSRRSRS